MGISYTLLTNGGGKHESAKMSIVNAGLGTSIPEDRLVQSHTPLQYFEAYKNQTILVLAQDPEETRKVFEG